MPCRAGKIADPRRFADQEPGVLVDLHLHDEVAGVKFAFIGPFLSPLELRHLSVGMIMSPKKLILPGNLHPPLQSFADRFLAVALHLEDVPIHFVRLGPPAADLHPSAGFPVISWTWTVLLSYAVQAGPLFPCGWLLFSSGCLSSSAGQLPATSDIGSVGVAGSSAPSLGDRPRLRQAPRPWELPISVTASVAGNG